MGKLDGKTAVVTGASRGIGQAIAELFAAEGASVICAARTIAEGDHKMLEGSLNRTIENIIKNNGKAAMVQANISEEDECVHLIDSANNIFGPVDILVNNAALNYYIPIVDYPTSRWIRSFAVNIHGPFVLSKLVLPDMMERNQGAIVNISSSAAIGPGRGPYDDQTVRGGTMYGASKAALERFTQGLAQEVSSYKIAVSALSPSQVVPTPGTVFHKLVEGMDDPKGEHPDFMAKAALLLASENPSKINGRVTYSQQILSEYNWITNPQGTGVNSGRLGSGYAQS